MKKILILAISLVLVLTSLVSCAFIGGGNPETSAMPETGGLSETESDTDAPETEPQVPVVVVPDYINPLTGLAAEEDLGTKRPVAIMINNLRDALPQEGISQCEIMYECLVEGGITRLMVVSSEYEKLGVIGSIRSCRHYYLDLAKNYDAIYVHAGGSDQGYYEVKQRGINNLDGVNMYIPNMFYRDKDRLQTMKYEHTLMTTGEKIADGIAYKKYRTELLDEFKYKTAFNFAPYGSERVPTGEDATGILLPYSKYQTARFDYDAVTNSYYRYQFTDMPHVDGTSGEQISFTNIMVLFCDVKNTGDKYGHLDIKTESESGEGYYIYGGKCEQISWSKPTEDSPITYYAADGSELTVNRGKTFISIFPDYNRENIQLNYVHSAE